MATPKTPAISAGSPLPLWAACRCMTAPMPILPRRSSAASGRARSFSPTRSPSPKRSCRPAPLSVISQCWPPGTMWWMWRLQSGGASLSPMCLPMAPRRWGSSPSPCCWRSATTSPATARASTTGSGAAAPTGAFGRPLSSSWRGRSWASSATGASASGPAASRRRWGWRYWPLTSTPATWAARPPGMFPWTSC